ncbi:MAG: hypothetical protein K2H93_01215 [Oscillospiraceae bacterium]|nr:hypothetical protein [Oscillospiraceae bacterium]
MHKLLEILYEDWHYSKRDSEEVCAVSSMLDESKSGIVLDCITAETQRAFQAGFQIAVQLLLARDEQ